MLSSAEVTTYREDNMYWAEACGSLELPPACAWRSLDRLLVRLIEIPAASGQSIKLVRANKDVPMTHVGNELIVRAAMLQGVIKASMSMKVMECVPESYLRLDVRTYNLSFAVIDFRIHPTESGCQLIFRQGFRSRQNMSKSAEEPISAKPRVMPETERIFNLWIELAQTIREEERFSEPPLSGATGG